MQERVWRAFYTKPRHELKILSRLEKDEYEVFCPTIRTKVKWSDRWKKVTKPMINGYIFVKVTEAERIEVLQDPSIWHTVAWKGVPAEIKEEEIQAMRDILNIDGEVSVETWNVGEKTSIGHGQLKGQSGKIVQLSKTEAVLYLESLHMSIKVKVPIQYLEKAKETT